MIQLTLMPQNAYGLRLVTKTVMYIKNLLVFWPGGKKCQKIVNIGVMRKDRAAQQRLFRGTILRGITQPLNAYGYKYFSL
jgi:hypothetical protein